MATRKHNRGFLAAFGTIALLMSPCATAQTQSQLNSSASVGQPSKAVHLNPSAQVVLIARIPPSVRLRSAVLPPPEQLREMLPENQQAAVLLLESQWTFASGQSVSAHGRLLDPPANDAALLALPSRVGQPSQAVQEISSGELVTGQAWKPVLQSRPESRSIPADIPVISFLPRALPQSVSLLRGFLPQRGPRNQLDGLLVVAPKSSEPQVVLLTVTAL